MRKALLLAVISCAAPSPRESFVLRIAAGGPLGDLTARPAEAAFASIAQPWVFEKLVTVDDAGELKPWLAASVERSPGGSIRLELRRDARFSDGTPVTDDDVVQSLEAGGLRVLKAAGALVVESKDRRVPPEPLLLQLWISRESAGKAIGSGPFAVASATGGELRLLRRQPQPGRINDVRIIAYAGPADAFAHTLKGDANAMVDLESRWLEFFQGVPSLQILRGAGRTADAIVFNARLPRSERESLVAVFASRRVRELAYEEGECAENASDGERATLPLGEPLAIVSWGPFERLALAARRALGERGGEIVQVAPQEALARLRARAFDLLTARPLRWPPSFVGLLWTTGAPENPSGYSNPAVDRAVGVGDWAAAEAALKDDPPAAFICTRPGLAVVDSRIRNARLGPYEALETLPDWEVAQ